MGELMMSNPLRTLLVFGAGCLIPIMAATAPSLGADDPTSVWQGVYTKAQAERGRDSYFAACASCHGTQLQGDTDAPDLAGSAFLKRWNDRSVGALFSFVESQMPVGRPRSLGAAGYADVVAHILASNGLPNGQKELSPNGSALDKIMIDRKK
jgi:S-disulfanyl-L-cysteine oxidoreductase SoxD